MFRFIGALLAFFAVFSAFAGVPIAAAVFALLTYIWFVAAKPAHHGHAIKQVDRWGNVY